MKKIKSIVSLSMVIFLTACGGGSSSGSNEGGNPFAGIYSGDHSVTFSGPGSTTTDIIFLTMTVNGDGSFRIVDGDGGAGSVPAVGTLNGSEFSATGTDSDTVDGIACDLRITFSGAISNNTAIGNDSGTATCTAQGRTITLNISGQFDLPRTGNAKAPKGGTLMSKAAALLLQ